MRALILVLLLQAPVAGAAELFVAPTGSDANPGTTDRPKLTLAGAAAVATPGDVVRVRKGSYTGAFFKLSGTAGAAIQFISTDGPGMAVLENASEPLRIGGGSSYLEFFDFEVRNSIDNAVHISENAHHILLAGLRVHDAGLGGALIQVKDAQRITIDGVEAFAPGASVTSPGSFRDAIELIHVTEAVVRRSFIHDSAGVLLSAKGSCLGITIEQNVIGRQDASANADPAIGLGGVSDAATLTTPNEVAQAFVRNNIIYGAGRGAIGIYDAAGAYIANNLFLNNDRAEITFLAGGGSAAGSDNVQVANNLFVDTRGMLATPYARASHTLTNFVASFNVYWNNGLGIPPATGGVPADTMEKGRLTGDPKVASVTSLVSFTDALMQARPGPMSSAETPGLDTSVPPFGVRDDIRGFLRGGRFDRGPFNLAVSQNGDGGVAAGDGGMLGTEPGPGGGGQLPPRGCDCQLGGRGEVGLGLGLALGLGLMLIRRRRA